MREVLKIHDIHKRLKGIIVNTEADNFLCEENSRLSIDNGIPKDIMKSIELVCKKSYPIQFESVLSLFDALYEHGTTGQLNKMANYICEEAAPKVRNAKDTNTNLRRKLGRLKSKVTTKIDNNIFDALGTVQNSIHKVQNNLKTNTNKIKANVNKGLRRPSTKTEAYIACYEQFIETFEKFEECDRIIENYNLFSKRFNLERLFVENTRAVGVGDTVRQLCCFVDTYDMPTKVKYMVAIETAWLGFEQHSIEYNKKEILEVATDHFMNKSNGFEECKFVLENTKIYQPEDMPSSIEVITELDPDDESNDPFTIHNNIKDQLTESEVISLKEEYNFNKIFNDFKKQEVENKEGKLIMLVRKLYTKNVTNIVDETPNFLNWIRRVFVLGSFALHPVVGAVVAIGDIFAQLHFERDETEKMIKCFDKEIKESNDKMKFTKDPEEKRRLKSYIDALKKSKKKIEDYYDKMLTDKELDAKFDAESDIDSFDDIKADITDSDENDDFDWDDFDDSFDEAAVNTIDTINTLIDEIPGYENIGMETITNMDIFNADDIDILAKLSVNYPDVWAPDLLENAIIGRLNRIRKGKIVFENSLQRFEMINAYENALKTISIESRKNNITIGECVNGLNNLVEAVDAINSIIYTHKHKNIMIEASFTNSLKLASEKLKKTMTKLSDKDKTISRNIDVSLSQFKKSAENAFTNENREAVIKGSVLPSASKIIKLAITTGALWIVEPALAVITALGYLGMSAKHKHKERQLILDEIEVELKICDKYIDIAESKNDMKSLKQLYTIQKNLKRQEQRLKYKMKVDFNQNPISTDND